MRNYTFLLIVLAIGAAVAATTETKEEGEPATLFGGFVNYVRDLMSPTNEERITKIANERGIPILVDRPVITQSVRDRMYKRSIEQEEQQDEGEEENL
jgi:hypothetical protein